MTRLEFYINLQVDVHTFDIMYNYVSSGTIEMCILVSSWWVVSYI